MTTFIGKGAHITIRWAALLIALTVTAASLLQVANVKPAFADSGGYPWYNAPCTWNGNTTGPCSQYAWGEATCPSGDGYCNSQNLVDGYYQFDQWGEQFRNCTSYAAWMLSTTNGFTMPFYDNAANWGTKAAGTPYNYNVNMTPAPGSIYWQTSPSPWGHVAWVKSVNGSSVTIEDYNSDTTGDYSGLYSVSASTANGYIHFKDLNKSNSRPAVISRGSGSMDVFYRDTSGNLINQGWNSGPGWGTATSKASSVSSNPTAVARDSTDMDVFYRDTNNNLMDVGWNTNGWGSPVARVSDGSVVGDPVVVSRSSGTMDVFYYAVINGNNKLMGVSWDTNGWSSPYTIVASGESGSPTAVARDSTDMDIFYRDSSNDLVDVGWSYNNGFSSPVNRVSGTATGDFSVVARDSGDMDVFYPTTSGGMGDAGWNWQIGWNVQTWSGSSLIATSGASFVGTPKVIMRDSGDMDVFYQDSYGNLVDKGWNSTNNWQAPYNRASNIYDNPGGVSRDSTDMDVFFKDGVGNLNDAGWNSTTGWNESQPGAGSMA